MTDLAVSLQAVGDALPFITDSSELSDFYYDSTAERQIGSSSNRVLSEDDGSDQNTRKLAHINLEVVKTCSYGADTNCNQI